MNDKITKNEDNVNNEENKHTDNVPVVEKKTKPRRRKKTVSDIELQILELEKKKKEMIEKNTLEIGEMILDILKKHDITLEDIEDFKEEFKDELEITINTNIDNFKELL